MGILTMYTDNYTDSTVISNRFIDDYMKDANDAEIKVYLYLVRMMSANLPTGVSDIADKFNHTEREVMRALKYWEKCGLLSLEYDESKTLTGIRFLSPESKPYVSTEHTPAQIVPIKVVADPAKEAPSYTREQLKEFKNNPDTSQLLFIAETYLKRPLTQSDIQTLYFIHDELKFSCELIDALLQYCVERNNPNFRYIKSVAIGWAEDGIDSLEALKAKGNTKYEKYVYSILKALGRTSSPVQQEADYAIRWYKSYGFTLEIIYEACSRTVKATDSHRLEYCDKILSSWKQSGVNSLSDISECDSSFKKNGSGADKTSSNAFNKFSNKTDYNFSELEKLISN